MVDLPDIPTLNRSVNEFRSLIAENTKRARALEKTKRAREAKADAELQSKITQLTDKIEKAGEKAKDTDKATLELLLNDEDAVNKFGRQNILEAAKVAGIALEDKGQPPPRDGTDANKGIPTTATIIQKIKDGDLGAGTYQVSDPPKAGEAFEVTQQDVNRIRSGV